MIKNEKKEIKKSEAKKTETKKGFQYDFEKLNEKSKGTVMK
jgi:hypothetical protein